MNMVDKSTFADIFSVRLHTRDLVLPPDRDPWPPKGSKHDMYIADITSEDESYNHCVCKFSNNGDITMFVYKLSNN